jgi:hypothetical protein
MPNRGFLGEIRRFHRRRYSSLASSLRYARHGQIHHSRRHNSVIYIPVEYATSSASDLLKGIPSKIETMQALTMFQFSRNSFASLELVE